MKYVLDSKDIRGSILEILKHRADLERKSRDRATTKREEGAHARAFRVVADLWEDIGKAEVV